MATTVYAPDGLVGRTSGGTTRQYMFDVQGNVAHAMTSSSAVSMSAAYTAWGQRNYVYPFQAPSQWDDCFGYNARWGYVKDATGLYYCQNRYYDPANGRWLTRDPIGYEGGINLYGYCGGGPVGAVDPSGNIFETLWDIGNALVDVWDIGSNLAQGNFGDAALAAGGLVLDLGATLIPGVPGGAGAMRRAGKGGVEALEVAKKLDKAEQVRENYKRGKLAEEKCFSELLAQGRNVELASQSIKTPFGRRFPDLIERDANNVILRLIEVKSGKATRSAAQIMKDNWIETALGHPTQVIQMP